MTTALLKTLSIAQKEQIRKQDPFARAKQKLLTNLGHQLKSAEAMLAGETYIQPKTITVKVDGQNVRKEVNKPIRTWYWRDTNGKIRFAIRVANKAVELEKGKTDIVVGTEKELLTIIKTVQRAVEAGELDKLIETTITEK